MKPSITRSRRRRVGTAAAVYSHALAFLPSETEAEAVAIAALRQGAHSRVAALAHARHLTQQRAISSPISDSSTAPKDLRDLARGFASTRPLTEQIVVDLELRYGLDHGSFSRVLGVSTARARERSNEITVAWAETLDPAMMAALGSGSCNELNQILLDAEVEVGTQPDGAGGALAATGTDPLPMLSSLLNVEGQTALSMTTLIQVAPAVYLHTKTCDECAQRLKLMTSVRDLVGQIPPEDVPDSVRDAARSAKRLLPSPLPPSIDADRIDLRRLRTIALVATSICAVMALGVGLVNFASNAIGSESQDDRVERLIAAAPASSLLATPSIVSGDTSTASLANNSAEPILWNATTSAPWLSVEPLNGRIAPSQSVTVVLKAQSSGSATITFTGSDGSRQTVRFEK